MYIPGERIGRRTAKHGNAKAWMEHFFNKIGDKMPHVEQIHLPSFLSKQAVYKYMVDDFTSDGLTKSKILCQSNFYALWKDEFSHCVIPKVLIAIVLHVAILIFHYSVAFSVNVIFV